jgi:hypothetical protein
MPRPSKRSAQAQSQRLAGSKSFGTVQMTGSDTGSVYSSENEDEDSSDGENDITALQSLYTSILPENLKFDQVKSKKRNRPARYNGDSRTTAWRQQKKWKKASGGCEKMDSYFQRIQLMRTGEVYDEEEDLMEDPDDYLASEVGIDLLDFCVDYLETSDDEGAEDNWVDEDELQVSLPFSERLYEVKLTSSMGTVGRMGG